MVAGVTGHLSQSVRGLVVEVYHFWVDRVATPDPYVVDINVEDLTGRELFATRSAVEVRTMHVC